MPGRTYVRRQASRDGRFLVAGGTLVVLSALHLLRLVDARTFWAGLAALFAACAAYALLGPAMAITLRQLGRSPSSSHGSETRLNTREIRQTRRS